MRFLNTPLLIVGLMLLVATGLDWDADLTWHDQHRIGQLALLGAVALGALSFWRKSVAGALEHLPRWAVIALTCAFGLGLASAANASYPRFAALEWATLLLLLGLALLLGMQSRQAGAFDKWANRLVVSLAVVIALKIMTGYLAAMITMGRLDTLMLFEGTFSNRRFFGQVASMIVPLLAYPLLRGGLSGLARVGLFGLLAVWWMLVIVSATRGTWVALLLASVLLAAWAGRAVRPWLTLQLGAFALGGLLFGVLFVWLPQLVGHAASIENRLVDLSALNGRDTLWAIAWAQIQAHPWLGIGPMHLASIRNPFAAHPHSAVLQLAAEWGVPAALALFLPATAGILSLLARLRRNRAAPDVLSICLTGSLLAAAAQSLVDGVIVIPFTQTLLALVAGWALGVVWRGTAAVPVAADSRLIRVAIPGLSVLALAALLHGAFPEVLNRAQITQAYVDAGHVLVPPRYWALGWIP